MENENNNGDLQMKPVESYEPLDIPKLEEALNNKYMMEKLPKRWLRNTLITLGLIGVGVAGLYAYVQCSSVLDDLYGHGGAGGGFPDYHRYKTEQEVLNILITQPEYAELRQYFQLEETMH